MDVNEVNKCFHLRMLTPNELIFEGKVLSLNCETTEGWYEVLPDHCAAIAALIPSIAKFTDENGAEYKFKIDAGLLKVRDNEVIILCGTSSKYTAQEV